MEPGRQRPGLRVSSPAEHDQKSCDAIREACGCLELTVRDASANLAASTIFDGPMARIINKGPKVVRVRQRSPRAAGFPRGNWPRVNGGQPERVPCGRPQQNSLVGTCSLNFGESNVVGYHPTAGCWFKSSLPPCGSSSIGRAAVSPKGDFRRNPLLANFYFLFLSAC